MVKGPAVPDEERTEEEPAAGFAVVLTAEAEVIPGDPDEEDR